MFIFFYILKNFMNFILVCFNILGSYLVECVFIHTTYITNVSL